MSYLFRYRLPLETQPSRSRLDDSIDINNFPPPKPNIERFNLHNFESSQYSLDTESTTLLVEFELNNGGEISHPILGPGRICVGGA